MSHSYSLGQSTMTEGKPNNPYTTSSHKKQAQADFTWMSFDAVWQVIP